MEAPPIERKLVAILAADIQGYSRLMGIDEENTLATLSAHRAIALREIPNVTSRMLVAFGEHDIKTVEDLADRADRRSHRLG